MKTVFGPIPSRRLGQSLGIDPIPLKTCNWNCVYCQLGRSRPMTNVRKEYVDPEIIISQLKAVLAAHAPGRNRLANLCGIWRTNFEFQPR